MRRWALQYCIAARRGEARLRLAGLLGVKRRHALGFIRDRAAALMKSIRDEAGYAEAHQAYIRAVTRLAVARRTP